MPIAVLIEGEIEVGQQKREHDGIFPQFYRRRNGREPNDVKITNHLEYLGMSIVYLRSVSVITLKLMNWPERNIS